MTDEHLRQLERRWRESRAHGDEVALIIERMRTGSLERSRVELAAYCGHPAARDALGGEAATPLEDLEEWGNALAPWGREVCVRAMVAAARAVLPIWGRFRPDDPRAGRAIELAEGWIDEPSVEHGAAAWSFGAEALWGTKQEVVDFANSDADAADRAAAALASHALTACSYAARFTSIREGLDIGGALLIAAAALGDEGPDDVAIRSAIEGELIAWALA